MSSKPVLNIRPVSRLGEPTKLDILEPTWQNRAVGRREDPVPRLRHRVVMANGTADELHDTRRRSHPEYRGHSLQSCTP